MRSTTADDLALLIEQIGSVSPRQACVLGDFGLTYLYDLIAAGEVESYLDGKSRKITLRSIVARRDRLLAEAKTAACAVNSPPRRKPGRPRKLHHGATVEHATARGAR